MSALSDDIKNRIRAYIPLYPRKQAVTLPALHLVHDEMRTVSSEAIVEIADILDLHPSEVRDTMTFYAFFKTDGEKQGKTRLWVCRGLACMLRGAYELIEHCEHKLGVKCGETTADGTITLEFAECIGACDVAPCFLVNDIREGPLRPDSADKLIAWQSQIRGTEPATKTLIESVRSKGRAISVAEVGSDERRNLQACRANALWLGDLLILRDDARKIEVLEEFLHGTQERLGLLRSMTDVAAEVHVKRFMLRHCRMLGIGAADQAILQDMLRGYLDVANIPHDNH